MVENVPTMQEPQVGSLGLKVPLEEAMATHSSSLAWRIPWTEEPGGSYCDLEQCCFQLRYVGFAELDMTEAIEHGTHCKPYFLGSRFRKEL